MKQIIIISILIFSQCSTHTYTFWEVKQDTICKDDLYFIRSGNYVKIGRSKDPNKRIKQLSTGNPNKLIMLHIEIDKGCLEKVLHSKFNQYHYNKEWYRYNSDIRKFIEYLKKDVL
jgi:hypothetical protein